MSNVGVSWIPRSFSAIFAPARGGETLLESFECGGYAPRSTFEGSMNRALLVSLVLAVFVFSGSGCAELEGVDFGQILAAGAPLDENTVASGLKQALQVGTERTTEILSAPGGFSANPALRLRLPGSLGKFADTLRVVGFGAQVDALELAMNEAAEAAAEEAVPVFASAITSMSISDAFAILNGPEDAATQYFRERTSGELRSRFEPITNAAMQKVGLYEIYGELVARYEAIPFTKPPAFDLEDYVADQTLSALFGELAKEEARIREDPAARSTALLRRVFGAAKETTSAPTG